MTAKCSSGGFGSDLLPGRAMVAYRLHFEPATLAAIESIRLGELEEIVAFSSTFAHSRAGARTRLRLIDCRELLDREERRA